ncbi:MAG: ABC transporter permease [Acidobacteria bacterium]|nr:ABC transporter permease [Acidobacteriota bacterium]
MIGLFQDFRFGFRMILKNPVFTAVAIATLAVGIGANTAFFSLLDAVLLRPLPVQRPEELVLVKARGAGGDLSSDFAYADYADYRDRCRSFSGLVAFDALPLTLTVAGSGSERIFAQGVSGNFFQVVGRKAELGRTLAPGDDHVGAEGAVMLSYRLWQSRFGGDPGAVGRVVTLEGKPYTIVGISPADFQGLTRGFFPDVWIPATRTAPFEISPDALSARNMRWLAIAGRVPKSTSRTVALAELSSVAKKVREENPGPGAGDEELVLLPGAQGDTDYLADVSRVSLLLMGVVGILLLIACANVGGLMLARASGRRREIAIRQALGAGRTRLIRQLLAESLLLAVLGGAAGLLLALWSADLLSQFRPQSWLPMDLGMRLDLRVLGFCTAVSLLAALLFGLAPALQASKLHLTEALKADSGAGLSAPSRRGWGASLVVVQVAMALVLLLGGGLFLRSLRREQAVDLGFNPRNALALSVQPGRGRSDAARLAEQGFNSSSAQTLSAQQAREKADEARVREFFRQLVEGAQALPGVRSAALVTTLTPSPGGTRLTLHATDVGLPGPGDVDIDMNWVGPGYFKTLGVPVLRGREFHDEDSLAPSAQEPVIVNQALARLLWPGQDPVGKRFSLNGPGTPSSLEVIGLAKDGKYRSLREAPTPYLYKNLRRFGLSERTLVLRTSGDPVALIPAVRSLVRSLDPTVPVYGVKTLEEHVAVMLAAVRLTTWLVSLFGLVALFLASLGLYGLISYAVLQRTREIGVRMALGARRGDVLRLVVGQGMKLILVGLALGLTAALLLTRLVAGLLFGISPVDPLTFAGIPLLLAGVALLACFLPARRASRVDPMIALRVE